MLVHVSQVLGLVPQARGLARSRCVYCGRRGRGRSMCRWFNKQEAGWVCMYVGGVLGMYHTYVGGVLGMYHTYVGGGWVGTL
ncbi:hypothetical protein K504DRAFT_97747 [Pleomassaria siparia CBS 279.74]|uniref:Uncharacterized protein n=1 Tax=Pleomassaria siparia CBS 279.74 TaxID=1314801 RepID=A0A6G1JY86_9PLEO|nr:hypothetical protein K504DRAFT_97747 [Pleomassaria siparia CBS 279.74]